MNRLEELILAWQDGSLSAADQRELNTLLAAPEARTLLVREFQFDTLTREALRQQTAEAAAETTAETFESIEVREPLFGDGNTLFGSVGAWLQRFRLRLVVPVAAVAAVLVLVAWLWFRPDGTAFALLTNNGGVSVKREGRTLGEITPAFSLKPGDEITVPSGAVARLGDRAQTVSLSLAGPARLRLDATGKQPALTLVNGSLSVSSTSDASLLVRTEATDLSMTGAEFTLLAEAGRTRLEVGSGSVIWRRLDDGRELNVAGGYFASVAPGEDFLAKSLLPEPWHVQDMGEVATTARASFDGSTLKLTGGGPGQHGPPWRRHREEGEGGKRKSKGGGPDDSGFHFVYRRLDGDGEIRARVVPESGAGRIEAGLIISRDLKEQTAMAFVGNEPGNPAEFRRGPHGGHRRGPLRSPEEKRGVPYWVRLVRQGDTVIAYQSKDGRQWTQAGVEKMDLGASAFVGLAATSIAGGDSSGVSFDHIAVIAVR